jgi:hypothetical protein
VLTTVGSILATVLATPLSPFLTRYLSRPLALARSAFDADSGVSASTKASSPVWVRLTVLRLIGIVPWSGINVACGVLGVGLWDCFLGTFIGAIPWTAVTCQVGVGRLPISLDNLTHEGWPLAIYIDRGYSPNRRIHAFTKSPNHLVCSGLSFYHHQARVLVDFISCPYPWPRLPESSAFACNLVCGCGRPERGTCHAVDVGQRVAHKGPFTIPFPHGTRSGAGAGVICGREDADAVVMSLFIPDCFHSHTALTSSNVFSRTFIWMNGTSSYIYIAYLTTDPPTATLFTVSSTRSIRTHHNAQE